MLETIFKKITISGYVRKVSSYINANYIPEPNHQIRYALRNISDQGDKSEDNQESDEVQFCYVPPKQQSIDAESEDTRHSSDTRKYNLPPTTRFDLASREPMEDRYNEARIAAVMKKYAFLDDVYTLYEDLDRMTNKTFVDALMIYMRIKGLQPKAIYERADIDRKLFSKIVCDTSYKPSKDTAVAIAIALQLTLEETNDLLSRAGYALSHSSKKDIIIEYFIREGIYNINDINEVLYRLDQKTIGR